MDYAIKIISKKRIKAKAGFSGRGQLARGPSRRTPPARKLSGASNNPLDKIHTEIAILKKCKHENIVCLKEVIDDSESPEQNIYLVFELMANGQVCGVFPRIFNITFSNIMGLKTFVHLLVDQPEPAIHIFMIQSNVPIKTSLCSLICLIWPLN